MILILWSVLNVVLETLRDIYVKDNIDLKVMIDHLVRVKRAIISDLCQ